MEPTDSLDASKIFVFHCGLFYVHIDRWSLESPWYSVWYTKAVIACGGGCWGILSLCQKLVPLWFPSISWSWMTLYIYTYVYDDMGRPVCLKTCLKTMHPKWTHTDRFDGQDFHLRNGPAMGEAAAALALGEAGKCEQSEMMTMMMTMDRHSCHLCAWNPRISSARTCKLWSGIRPFCQEPPIDMGAFDPMRFDSSYVPTVAKGLPPKLMATWLRIAHAQCHQWHISLLKRACAMSQASVSYTVDSWGFGGTKSRFSSNSSFQPGFAWFASLESTESNYQFYLRKPCGKIRSASWACWRWWKTDNLFFFSEAPVCEGSEVLQVWYFHIFSMGIDISDVLVYVYVYCGEYIYIYVSYVRKILSQSKTGHRRMKEVF